MIRKGSNLELLVYSLFVYFSLLNFLLLMLPFDKGLFSYPCFYCESDIIRIFQYKEMLLIPFSDEELKPAVANVIDKVRPSIKLDGGDIELIDVKDGIVYVQLQGACVGCGSAGTTLKFGVERQLKTLIHPEITVMNVPKGWEDKLDQLG
jgi:Fe-S cluster biogenesis protein NfuA